MLDEHSDEYFEQREAEERLAAESADSEAARKIHLALADRYAKARHNGGRRTLGIKTASAT